MNIKVILDKGVPLEDTGGEYAISSLEIYVNSGLDERKQRILVIHAILENWFPSLTHQKIDDLTTELEEALDQLEGASRTYKP